MRKAYWMCVSISLMLACTILICSFLELELVTILLSFAMIVFVIVACILYFGFVKFKCPKCNTVFKGNRWETIFAFHTPQKRKIHCPVCKEKLWCEAFITEKRN